MRVFLNECHSIILACLGKCVSMRSIPHFLLHVYPFSDEHSGKVKSFMLDVLSPLITEADFVSNELLDIILVNIVEPQKTQRKNAFMLAKELIVKTSATLEPYIQGFFNQVCNLICKCHHENDSKHLVCTDMSKKSS